MNRSCQLRLGSRGLLMDQWPTLISGPLGLCSRSARLSVPGTRVRVDLDERGGATASGLKGRVELEALHGPTAPTTSLTQGTRLRPSADGRVLSLTTLGPEDDRTVVEGGLVGASARHCGSSRCSSRRSRR